MDTLSKLLNDYTPYTDHATIPDLLAERVARHGDRVAMADEAGNELTGGQIAEIAERLGAMLRAHGIGRTTRVAIVMPNGMGMALTLLSVSLVATAAPFNPANTVEELTGYFRAVNAGALITVAGGSPSATEAAGALNLPVLALSCGPDFRLDPIRPGRDPGGAGGATDPAPGDIALIMLTSGSTGRAKKVPLSHRNLCAAARFVCGSMRLTPEDRGLCVWEQFHIGGFTVFLMAPLLSGGRIIYTSGFDKARIFDQIAAHRPSWVQAVPTMLHHMTIDAARRRIDCRNTSLRLIRATAAALHPDLLDRVEALFGVPVCQAYGMTEASPTLATMPVPPAERRRGSVGTTTGPELRIIGADGSVLGPGETGELIARGPNLVAGYEDDPEATAESFRDGWYHTGDLAYLDRDGYLYVSGRKKHMINRGGESVNPQEIDDVLMTHPGVAQAATFPVPHRTLGENVAAAIVPRPGAAPTIVELRRFAMERMATFKVPQRIVLVDELPRNAVGKIDRAALTRLLTGKPG